MSDHAGMKHCAVILLAIVLAACGGDEADAVRDGGSVWHGRRKRTEAWMVHRFGRADLIGGGIDVTVPVSYS